MTSKDRIYLGHILEKIEDIENSTSGVSEKEFEGNRDLVDANIRRIEIIGEAAKNISIKAKKEHPEIEWKQIAGTRDVLVHAYFSVDLDLVWSIIRKDLKILKKQIEKILQKEY
jgi:uncharacterized protein with HEPN domain